MPHPLVIFLFTLLFVCTTHHHAVYCQAAAAAAANTPSNSNTNTNTNNANGTTTSSSDTPAHSLFQLSPILSPLPASYRTMALSCDRAQVKKARKIIQEHFLYTLPSTFKLSPLCPFHPANDFLASIEDFKKRSHNSWQCGKCSQTFNDEKEIDQHLIDQHVEMREQSVCLAEYCHILDCDHRGYAVDGATGHLSVHDSPSPVLCNKQNMYLNQQMCYRIMHRCIEGGGTERRDEELRLYDIYSKSICGVLECHESGVPLNHHTHITSRRSAIMQHFRALLFVFIVIVLGALYFALWMWRRSIQNKGNTTSSLFQINSKNGWCGKKKKAQGKIH